MSHTYLSHCIYNNFHMLLPNCKFSQTHYYTNSYIISHIHIFFLPLVMHIAKTQSSFCLHPGLRCTLITGKLKQVDAGAGQVYGVNDADDIFRLVGKNWEHVSGKLIHVSVGPGGIWGTNRQNNIFKFQDGGWVQVAGSLKQVDAGGDKYLGGVNSGDNIFCLDQDSTLSTDTTLPFIPIEGRLMYYSCGLHGCWGVNSNNAIFYRLNVSPDECRGSEWKMVEGNMIMVEVGTDGSVYGINTIGSVYKRQGISVLNPIGTAWSLVNVCGPFKHVSYDEGMLWLLNTNGDIFKCDISYSSHHVCLHVN
ncbi:fish-egg lectin-like isoform X1 [Pelobates fuscus]|uniref:fish-egg lectin-like isoform X1 n=1 Tax=Pelobates fuscus TaxID=191477 RepID=UPI002FE4B7ED